MTKNPQLERFNEHVRAVMLDYARGRLPRSGPGLPGLGPELTEACARITGEYERQLSRGFRLDGADRRFTVALVSCSKSKVMARLPARALYSSRLFRLSRDYAERYCDRYVILSAKHGVLTPDARIEPYDMTLAGMKAEDRAAWGERVVRQFDRLFPRMAVDMVELVLLCGERYREPFEAWGHYKTVAPMRGLGIGQQIGWLSDRLREGAG